MEKLPKNVDNAFWIFLAIAAIIVFFSSYIKHWLS